MKLKLRHHFDAAHRLEFHKGLCRNLHGHRWDVLIEIEQEEVENMILDFGEIKKIIDEYDHSCILSSTPENHDLLTLLYKMELRVIHFNDPPTAENLVRAIHGNLQEILPLQTKLKVTLWESPGAGISYEKI